MCVCGHSEEASNTDGFATFAMFEYAVTQMLEEFHPPALLPEGRVPPPQPLMERVYEAVRLARSMAPSEHLPADELFRLVRRTCCGCAASRRVAVLTRSACERCSNHLGGHPTGGGAGPPRYRRPSASSLHRASRARVY